MTTLFFIGIFILVPLAHAQKKVFENIGLVENNIWYSSYPFLEGEKIKIFSLVFNSGRDDFQGRVEFYDNTNSIGVTDFMVPRGSSAQEVSVVWTPNAGDHTITAEIIDAFLVKTPGAPEKVDIKQKRTGQSTISVDFDTDSDGVGNMSDADDDNDGRSDQAEMEKGTNPLKKDEHDGVLEEHDTVDVVKGAKSVLGAIDQFRVRQGRKVELARKNLNSRQDVPPSSFTKARGAGFLALDAIFNYRILFYIVFASALYLIYKMLLHRKHRRK